MPIFKDYLDPRDYLGLDPMKPGGIKPEELKRTDEEQRKILPEIFVPKIDIEPKKPIEEEVYVPETIKVAQTTPEVYIPETKPELTTIYETDISKKIHEEKERERIEKEKEFKEILKRFDEKIKEAERRQPFYARFLGPIAETTEVSNLKKAKRLFENIYEEELTFIDMFEAFEESVLRGKAVPFYNKYREITERKHENEFQRKLLLGEPLDERDESFVVLEKVKALHKEMTGDNFFDQYIISTSEDLPSMFAYVTEFALTKGILKTILDPIKVSALKGIPYIPGERMISTPLILTKLFNTPAISIPAKNLLPNIAVSMANLATRSLIGGAAIAMGPVLAERLLPDYILSFNEENELIAELDKKGEPFFKALAQSLGVGASEWIFEHAGFIVNEPINFLKRAILRNIITKKGLNNIGLARNFFEKIGFSWSGLIGETLEERLQHYSENIITGKELKSPISPEELDNTLREFIGVSMLSLSGASANLATRGLARFKEKSEEIVKTIDPDVKLLNTLERYKGDVKEKIKKGEITEEQGKKEISIVEDKIEKINEMKEKRAVAVRKPETIVDTLIKEEQEKINKGEATLEQIDLVNRELGLLTRDEYIEAADIINDSIETKELKENSSKAINEARKDLTNVLKAYSAYKMAIESKEKEEQKEVIAVAESSLEEKERLFFEKIKIKKGEEYHDKIKKFYEKLINKIKRDLGITKINRSSVKTEMFKDIVREGLIIYDKNSDSIESPFVVKKTSFTEEEIKKQTELDILNSLSFIIKFHYLEPDKKSINEKNTKNLLKLFPKGIKKLIKRGDLIYDKKAKKLLLRQKLSQEEFEEIMDEELKEFYEKQTPLIFKLIEETDEYEEEEIELQELVDEIEKIKEPEEIEKEKIERDVSEEMIGTPSLGFRIYEPVFIESVPKIIKFSDNTYNSFLKDLKEKYVGRGLNESQIEKIVHSYFNFFDFKEGRVAMFIDENNEIIYWFSPKKLFKKPELNEVEIVKNEKDMAKMYGDLMMNYSSLRSEEMGFDFEVVITENIETLSILFATDIKSDYELIEFILKEKVGTIKIPEGTKGKILGIDEDESGNFNFIVLLSNVEGIDHPIVFSMDPENGEYFFTGNMLSNLIKNPEKIGLTSEDIKDLKYNIDKVELERRGIWHVIENVVDYDKKAVLTPEEARRKLNIINEEIKKYNKLLDTPLKLLKFYEAFKVVGERPARFSDITGFVPISRINVPIDYLLNYKTEFEVKKLALERSLGKKFEEMIEEIKNELSGKIITLDPQNMEHPIIARIGKKLRKRGKTDIVLSPDTTLELLGYENTKKTFDLKINIGEKQITFEELLKEKGGEVAIEAHELYGKIKLTERLIKIEEENLINAHENYYNGHHGYINNHPIVVTENESREVEGIKTYEIKDENSYIRFIAYNNFLSNLKERIAFHFENGSSYQERIRSFGNDALIPIAVSKLEKPLKSISVSKISASTKLQYINYIAKINGIKAPTFIHLLKEKIRREPRKTNFNYKQEINEQNEIIKDIVFNRIKTKKRSIEFELSELRRIENILKKENKIEIENQKNKLKKLLIDKKAKLDKLKKELKIKNKSEEEIDSIKDKIKEKEYLILSDENEIKDLEEKLKIFKEENLKANNIKRSELLNNLDKYKTFLKKIETIGLENVIIKNNKISYIKTNYEEIEVDGKKINLERKVIVTEDLDKKSIEIYENAKKEVEESFKNEIKSLKEEIEKLKKRLAKTREDKKMAAEYGDLKENASYQQSKEEESRLINEIKNLNDRLSYSEAIVKDGIENVSNLIKEIEINERLRYSEKYRKKEILDSKKLETYYLALELEQLLRMLDVLNVPVKDVVELLKDRQDKLRKKVFELLPLEKKTEITKEIERKISEEEKESIKQTIIEGAEKINFFEENKKIEEKIEEIENTRKEDNEKSIEQLNELLDIHYNISSGNIFDIEDIEVSNETRNVVEALYSPSDETKAKIKESEKISEEQKKRIEKDKLIEKVIEKSREKIIEKEDKPELEKEINESAIGNDNGGIIDNNDLDEFFKNFKNIPENLSGYMKEIMKVISPYVNKVYMYGYNALEHFYFPLMNADKEIRKRDKEWSKYFNKILEEIKADDLKLEEEHSLFGAIKAISDKLNVDSNLLLNIYEDDNVNRKFMIESIKGKGNAISMSDLDTKPELENLRRLYYVVMAVYRDIISKYNIVRIENGKVFEKKDGELFGLIKEDLNNIMAHLSFISTKGWAYMVNTPSYIIEDKYKRYLETWNLERKLEDVEPIYFIDKKKIFELEPEEITTDKIYWQLINAAITYKNYVGVALSSEEAEELLEKINNAIINYNEKQEDEALKIKLLSINDIFKEKKQKIRHEWEFEPEEREEIETKIKQLKKKFNRKGFNGGFLLAQTLEGLLHAEIYTPVFKKMREKLNYKGMLSQKNPFLYKAVTDQINFLEGKKSGLIFKNVNEERLINRVANYLRHSIILVIIAGSFSIIAVQPYSLASTFGEFGPISFIRGFWKGFANVGRRLFGWIVPEKEMTLEEKVRNEIISRGEAGVMKERIDIYDHDTFKAFYDSVSWADGYFGQRILRKASLLRDKFADHVMKYTIQMSDRVMANITFNAAIEHAFAGKAEGIESISEINLNNEEEREKYINKVYKYASIQTEKTQGSGAKRNTARIRQTPVEAALTVIQTFMFAQFTLMMEKIQTFERAIRGKKVSFIVGGDEDKFKLMLGSFLFFLWFSIYTSVLSHIYSKLGISIGVPRPIKEFKRTYKLYKEGKADFEDLFLETSKELLELIPIISTYKYGKNLMVIQSLEDSYNILYSLLTGQEIPYNVEPEKTIALLIKFPFANQIVKTLRAAVDIERGYKVPNEELRIEIKNTLDIISALLFGSYWTKSVQDWYDGKESVYENIFNNLTPPRELNFMDKEMRKEYFKKKRWALDDFWKTIVREPEDWYNEMLDREYEMFIGITPEQEKKKKQMEAKRKQEQILTEQQLFEVSDEEIERLEKIRKYIGEYY